MRFLEFGLKGVEMNDSLINLVLTKTKSSFKKEFLATLKIQGLALVF